MEMRHSWSVLFVCVLPVLATLMLSGCRTAPERFTPEDLESPEVIRQVASEYWSRHDFPPLRDRGYRRIVITEFAVDFVTVKLENFGESQLILTPPPVAPVGLVVRGGIAAAGVQKKVVQYEDALYSRATERMYEQFTSSLEELGLEVVDAAEVQASQSVSEGLRFADDRSTSSGVRRLNLVASDTGRTKAFVTQPSRSTGRIVEILNGEIEDVEARLLEEIGADAAVRIRMRIGVFRGHASIERGSRAWVYSNDAAGNLELERSLLSSDIVLEESDFDIGRGTQYTVDSERYMAELAQLFPAAIRMAFETGRAQSN